MATRELSVSLAASSGSKSAAQRSLSAAATFWLLVAVAGQWAFLYYIVTFYGRSTLLGDFAAWTKATFLRVGYVPGDDIGNLTFGLHALLAAVIAFGGALQLVPQLRSRFAAVHRWNGRLFIATALSLSITGFYLVWVRGKTGNLPGKIAISLNAVMIIAGAVLAWRTARARDIVAHRGWALRLFMLANAQWFLRVGLFAWIIVNRGPVGIGKNFDGPFVLFWEFGCYLVPLAVLEAYMRVKEAGTPLARYAAAGGLVVLTLLMGVGIFGVASFMWVTTLSKM